MEAEERGQQHCDNEQEQQDVDRRMAEINLHRHLFEMANTEKARAYQSAEGSDRFDTISVCSEAVGMPV